MRLAAVALATLGIGAAAVAAASHLPPDFPHATHDRLFPLCLGCHGGVETGVEADLYPEPEECADCHDGVREDRVRWTPPGPRPSFLDFSHREHPEPDDRPAEERGDPAGCRLCHAPAGDESGEEVQRPSAETCMECHAHEAPRHLAPGRDCSVCHPPLTDATALSRARIADFPRPPGHDREDFVLDHDPGDTAGPECATCHARESCTRCHRNADGIPEIAALEPDPRVADLVEGREAEYPRPPSHGTATWDWAHGDAARARGEGCANCHTLPDCRSCHVDRSPLPAGVLPAPGPGEAPQVPSTTARRDVHPEGFFARHGSRAVVFEESCSSCHAEETCEGCHRGQESPGFHPADYLERHGPEGYGNRVDCSACHNAEVFCRGCHQEVGMGGPGRGDVAFHTARPLWLLGHGVAARQGLEGCVTCHTQADCAQCHAAVGAWRVNPHGPGFDPEAALEANPLSCALCHPGGVGLR